MYLISEFLFNNLKGPRIKIDPKYRFHGTKLKENGSLK